MTIEELKSKQTLLVQDIEELLASIGSPGENRDEKIAAVKELERTNFQSIKLEDSLADYGNF